MKITKILLSAILLLSLNAAVFAQRQLERSEILQIFQSLTSQPMKGWIPAGTIQATHEEYRAPKVTDSNEIGNIINQKIQEYQCNPNKPEKTEELQKMKLDAIPFNVRYKLTNEYTMSSTETVKFDGERFYWEINVSSRTDSIKPGSDLAGNSMTDEFNLAGNASRIFVWDGEQYKRYFKSGNCVTVDSTGSVPHAVNGPLTAGIIPWGYGRYTYDNLCSAGSSAVETEINGQTQVVLTLAYSDGMGVSLTMDPGKNYAVLSCTMNCADGAVITRQCSNFESVSGRWIPKTISLERYENNLNQLLASDLWQISSIDTTVPQSHDFEIRYEKDALIEYYSTVSKNPSLYRHSDMVDTEQLLAERLIIASTENEQVRNCATVALKHTLSQLGKDVTEQQLAQLVNQTAKTTNLSAMKAFVKNSGLYCRTVTTDIQTLKNLNGCEVILHIPGSNHFVVFSDMDSEYARIIDLMSNKFYYRTDLSVINMDWSEGTALIISQNRIEGQFTDIAEDRLSSIVGGAYSCTKLLQDYYVIYCERIGSECDGDYEEHYLRYGCQSAPSGSCSSSIMLRYVSILCITDPYDPDGCTVYGDWSSYYMRACA